MLTAYARAKGGENKCFRITSGETGVYYIHLALQYIYGSSDEGGENGDEEEGSEISGGGKKVEIA